MDSADIKVVLLGEVNAGKTSVFIRFFENTWNRQYNKSVSKVTPSVKVICFSTLYISIIFFQTLLSFFYLFQSLLILIKTLWITIENR